MSAHNDCSGWPFCWKCFSWTIIKGKKLIPLEQIHSLKNSPLSNEGENDIQKSDLPCHPEWIISFHIKIEQLRLNIAKTVCKFAWKSQCGLRKLTPGFPTGKLGKFQASGRPEGYNEGRGHTVCTEWKKTF